MMSRCPKCGSDDIHQDSADIGVGVQYGPLACNACDYDENDEFEELGLLDLEQSKPDTFQRRYEVSTYKEDMDDARLREYILKNRIRELEAALHEIADFSEQFIMDDEDSDERMYKVNQIADTAIAHAASGATTAANREGGHG
jgi:hypothetical protein